MEISQILAWAVIFWLIVSVFCQLFVSVLTKLRRYDPFGLLPSWHFFAPNPARFDTVFLYRKVEGEVRTEWFPASTVYDEKWWYSIVNPQRRYQKSCHDLQNSIGNMYQGNSNEVIAKSSPVLALQDLILSNSNDASPIEDIGYQFCVVRILNARTESPSASPVYISEVFHIKGNGHE